MSKFFIDSVSGEYHRLYNEDFYHICKTLRMKKGEKLFLCDKNKIDHECVIEEYSDKEVFLKIINSKKCISEPENKVTLLQGIPKNDKMDLIVQKSVEVGVFNIVPVFMKRCISRPDEKSLNKKIDRWQKISKEAAKQSGRGIIPEILPVLNFLDAVNFSTKNNKVIAFYEGQGEKIQNFCSSETKSMSVFVGPEGGFEPFEIDLIKSVGGRIATLGPRILRAETAAIVSIAIISYLSEN